jgi:oxygen-independent coproporphyrinogen-3 oxidase
MPAGIYVHIPFCRSKCPYCGFYSVTGDDSDVTKFYNALLQEIDLAADTKWQRRIYNSIYFGGGTPPLLGENKIGKIIQHIRHKFNITPNAEISIEANPESIDKPFLDTLLGHGVNRLTIGVQSFNDHELKLLGRIHDSSRAIEAFEKAAAAGFENIGIDLIFAIPGQTTDSWQATLNKALEMAPAHISAYGLTVEKGTPFAQKIDRGELTPVDNDTQAEMYQICYRLLTENGYSRYEVSNYAKTGFECRHNLKYWTDQKYLGLGPSAHSYYTSYRKANYRSFDKYLDSIKKNKLPVAFKEMLTTEQKSQEKLMLGLRTASGLDFISIKDIINQANLDTMIEQDYLKLENDKLALTDKGFLMADEIVVKLLKK